MNKNIVISSALAVAIIFAAIMLSPLPEVYRLHSISKELKSGQPFIKVFTVSKPPIELHVGHGNLGQGTLWLVKVGPTSATTSEKTATQVATINGNDPFVGDFKYKNSSSIPETGTYYFSFLSTESNDQRETKSNLFEIKSNAPFIKNVSIEPNTIRKGASALITWNTENVSECTLSSLDLKTNAAVVVKNALPESGSLQINPQTSTQYQLHCSGTEEFTTNYPSAVNSTSETGLLFVQ